MQDKINVSYISINSIRIQRWWRKFKAKPQAMVVESIKEEKELKNNWLIKLEEDDYEDTALSSMEDSGITDKSSILNAIMINKAYEMTTGYIHKNKKSEDYELEEILEREYELADYRLYKNIIEEYQQRNCPWSFYPVVSEYPTQQSTMQNQSVPYNWSPIIMPYYEQPYRPNIYSGHHC